MLHDYLLPNERTSTDVDDQARRQAVQLEVAIEAVGESGKVLSGVHKVLAGVVAAAQLGLGVAHHDVQAQELRQISRFAVTGDNRPVTAARGGDGREATQTDGDDRVACGQWRHGQLASGIGCNPADQAELEEAGSVLIAQRHGSHEWCLNLQTPGRLIVRTLASDVGVVDLKDAHEPVDILDHCNGAVDLLMQQLGGQVSHKISLT